jgi:hypothetical protein
MLFRLFRTNLNCQHWLAGGLAFCLLLIFSPQGTRAQGLSGITGTITDESGAVIPGVTVTATNNATGVSSHTATTSVGTYTITDLIPGVYTVKVDKAGFQTSVLNNVNVDVGKFSTTDAILKVGSTTQTIEVTATPIALETTQPQLGTIIESKIQQEVPTLIGGGPGNIGPRDRQIDDLIFLAPGVQGGEFEHRINGGVSYQNEVMFNGVVAVQSETQGMQSNINPPFEMVNEIEALTSNFGAQYGLAQGVASYRFASGTNQLHGDGFEVLRNTILDAAGVAPPGTTPTQVGPTPVINQNSFGFSVGGPVFIPKIYNGKNKTFFYTSFDWFRLNSSEIGTNTIPTPAEVGGDFSAYPASIGLPANTPTIFVPQNFVAPAGCTAPAPGQPWPNNTIPTSCFSTTAKTLLSLIPPPTRTGPINNFDSNIPVQPTRQTNFGFSIDHNLTQSQKLHVSFWRDNYITPQMNGAYIDNELGGMETEPRLGTGIFPTYSKVFSSSLVMTAGFGWMGEINNELNDFLGHSFPGVVSSISLPAIDFNSPFGLQPSNWGLNSDGETFSKNRKLGLSLDNNWLYTRGRHTLNIGWELRRSYQDDHECQTCGGNFSFTTRTTADPNNINTTGSAFASFLLGDADSAFRKFVADNHLRNLLVAPYVQDNIKVTPRLTVNAGARWDLMRPFDEEDDNVVFFNSAGANAAAVDPATGQPLLGVASKLGTCTGCAGYRRATMSLHHFSPRAGFAYELNKKTVILGGYAMNFLDGGAYEYGNNKLSVQFGSLLTGIVNVTSFGSNIPRYGEWDGNPLAVPVAGPFDPTSYNGTGVLRQFSQNPGKYPYTQTWNAGIQRELPWTTLLSVSYVGNRQLHMPSMLNPINQTDGAYLGQFCASANPSDPNCLMSPGSSNFAWTSAASQAALKSLGFGQFGGYYTPYNNFMNDYGAGAGLSQALLPYPMYNPSESSGGLTNPFDMNGMATYNALQVQAQKRFTSGLTYLVNYTLSRTMSNTDSGFATFNWGAENKANQKSEYSIAANDQTHIVNISGVYELPIGPGKRFLSKGGLLAKNALGGWQLSGVLSYLSGIPVTVYCNDNDVFLNGFNRCNYNPSVPLNVNYRNYYQGKPVFNTAAFSDPGFTQGNEPRNLAQFRNPFNENENIALSKHFYFGERVTAELRIEFFNIFNRMQVCGPTNSPGVDTSLPDGPNYFGYVNANGAGGSNPCQGNTPRQGQAYFKLSF